MASGSGGVRPVYAAKLASIGFVDFQERTGLRLEGEHGGLREDLPPIQRWLNRLLALPIALQNAIFDEYLALVETRVEAAREAGTLDLGVETLAVERFGVTDDRVIRTDARTGATTHLLKIEVERRARPMRLEAALRLSASRSDGQLLVNQRSGRAALRVNGRSLMTEEGVPLLRYELIRPLKREHLARDRFSETSWEPASAEAFSRAWEVEVEEAVATLRRETLHLATGLLLPVWDKLPDDLVQVLRIVDAEGHSLLGREIPALALAELGARFGLDLEPTFNPREIAAAVLGTGRSLQLKASGSLQLKRSLVGGAQRLELTGFEAPRLPEYKALGCFTEIIRYQTRLFVPVDRAAEILAKLVR